MMIEQRLLEWWSLVRIWWMRYWCTHIERVPWYRTPAGGGKPEIGGYNCVLCGAEVDAP